eukprot:Lithocolla_globosa_v1_NODE_1658_length_2414_cov_455.281475.p1 type:complete len:170 gc:universal NODE_1658_length_2414_cov_455.281475:1520-1011(-)
MSIKEDGIHHLAELIEHMKMEEDSDDESDEDACEVLLFGNSEISVKVKKPKKISQKYLIIFDDIASELKDPYVSQLLKTNRHYKSKVIISSQWLNDITPQSRRQIDFYLLFSGINMKKLEELYNDADLSISFEEFVNIYNIATRQKYHFLYIDSNNSEFRINFNTSIEI